MDNISKIPICLVAADLPLYKPSVCSVCSLDENITFFCAVCKRANVINRNILDYLVLKQVNCTHGTNLCATIQAPETWKISIC